MEETDVEEVEEVLLVQRLKDQKDPMLVYHHKYLDPKSQSPRHVINLQMTNKVSIATDTNKNFDLPSNMDRTSQTDLQLPKVSTRFKFFIRLTCYLSCCIILSNVMSFRKASINIFMKWLLQYVLIQCEVWWNKTFKCLRATLVSHLLCWLNLNKFDYHKIVASGLRGQHIFPLTGELRESLCFRTLLKDDGEIWYYLTDNIR